MDSQQQSIYNFSQQMNSTKQAPSSSQQNPATTGVVSTPIYKEPHILDREPHIHLATPFDKLAVLCETLVDFDNMKRNGNAEGKHSKNKELHQNLRVWLKIILGTIHHRPASNCYDYINTDLKYMMYCLHKGLKLCLPALLFKYLRDSVKETINNMKTRNYIPLGRLISDVLIESGLVDHLIQLRLMEDVMIDTGRPLNARNMKSMGIIDQVRAKPTLDTSWETLKDQREIPNGLYLFSKINPPEVIAYYLEDLYKQGVDITEFSVD
ncbi:hypothetical protein KIW84_061775 [Lathyrus oleraceus]|uniref:Uncharacterized protein n=1 Tax=Pisum sativum TaxID=3888 RepID=A0A9D4W544_PEA|nr:hypothetical protein KIW84_061775 [Pisum sativum]